MNEKTKQLLSGLVVIFLCTAVSIAGVYLGARALEAMAPARTAWLRPAPADGKAIALPQRLSHADDQELRHIVALMRGQGLRPKLANVIAERIMNREGTVEVAALGETLP